MDDAPDLQLPPDVTADEAAAITAAVEQWLAAERDYLANGQGGGPWDGKRFEFAGRLAKLTGESARIPREAPPNPWTATGRRDRF